MKLLEVIQRLGEFDDELTIYAESDSGWSETSAAAVELEPEDGGLPPGTEGLEYFLEVDLAKQVIEVWSQWRDGKTPSASDACRAVIYYADNDAFLPV